MRTKMPDELKIGDRLITRGVTGMVRPAEILSILAVHVPVGPEYIPAFAITLEGDVTPVLADPRTPVEVAA